MEVLLRRTKARTLERRASVVVVRIRANSLGEFDDREVVVLRTLGALSGAQGVTRSASGGENTGQERRSHPPGRPTTALERRR
jgi:hypothetical protein